MAVIFGIIGAVLGAALMDEEGLVFGFASGFLFGMVIRLKNRVNELEMQFRQAKESTAAINPAVEAPEQGAAAPEHAATKDTQPTATMKVPVADSIPDTAARKPDETQYGAADSADSRQGHFQESIEKLLAAVHHFFTSGNVVVKVGVIILFFGISFLLKYAAERNAFPVELRLSGVALGGIALLAFGWRLRNRRAGYGLILQGAGIGVLYLTVFAAAKLYSVLPAGLAFALMFLLVALSGVLAVLQDARSLAVFGTVGGFLAPVLTSTGSGSHVMLFSYYALLNAGIVGIAWFKSWRVLNWLGFLFTFVIGTAWGYRFYRPEHFSTTEPFLVLFFLFYLTISVMFAFRQPPRLKGYVDGSLVFGLPLATFALQSRLVRDFEFGDAITALVMSGIYLGLAEFLWRRQAPGMRVLTESFLGLGVVFLSLAVPLALDGRWTAAVWALEGAGLIWIGVRQSRFLTRCFGVVLQIGAGLAFLTTIETARSSLPLFNSAWVGTVLVSIAALFSSAFYYRHSERLRDFEKPVHIVLLLWGVVWWAISGGQEIQLHVPVALAPNATLLFATGTTLALAWISENRNWPPPGLLTIGLLPFMVLMAASGYLDHSSVNPLARLGFLAWPAAFIVHYLLLYRYEEHWPGKVIQLWHPLGMWLATFLLAQILAQWLTGFRGLSAAWPLVAWAVVPASVVLVLMNRGDKLRWPVMDFDKEYRGTGLAPLVIFLLIWTLLASAHAGNPAPLPYVPLINPLDLAQAFALLMAITWYKKTSVRWPAMIGVEAKFVYGALGVVGFVWLNAMIARTVHFMGKVPYRASSLFDSGLFQSSASIVWSLGAMGLMILANRKQWRILWFTGAGLLALVVAKLFLIDLAGTGTVARIISFLAVGILMLTIGYLSPLPPKTAGGEE